MGNDTNNKYNNYQNNESSQELGKTSIIDYSLMKSHNQNIISKENFNELVLKGIKDISTNLISLNKNEKSDGYKNNGFAVYDSVVEEMKIDFIKKKNKKFKYEIKNEIKNTLIKPILDSLKIKDEEISEMKSQITDLTKNFLETNSQLKKEYDSKIENLENKNKELFEKYNLDMGKIINKYDKNFLNLNKQIEALNLNQKNFENKNEKEIENLQNKIFNEINSLKNQIISNINKRESEYNSKFENIIKFTNANLSKIENLRKQYEIEIKTLKKDLNEKIISNQEKVDNAIKEIEIINKNSKKDMLSIVNESFKKFNITFQKNFDINKYKAQRELKIKLFTQKNYARVGLTNLGNNCYLNSVLQILKNIPKFTYNFYLMDENSDRFLLSLKKLFLNTCFSKNSSFSPEEFKNNLGKENRIFDGDNQYDSTIFYISLLNIIHKKLYKTNCNYKNLNMNQYKNKSLEEKFKIWKENYLSKNQTFITEFFYTFYMSEIECNSCHNKTQSFQCTNFLDFPIITQNSEVKSLEECFFNYQMVKSLTNECSECNNDKLSQHFTILELPPILIINLKRVGEGDAHFNDIEIPFQLDMEKLIKNSKINSIYELRGFIKHLGDEISGHNYSFCKNMFDDKWYEYNDSNCIPINGKPTMDRIFLLCYAKVGCDIQDVYYLKRIMDSLDEQSLSNKLKKY